MFIRPFPSEKVMIPCTLTKAPDMQMKKANQNKIPVVDNRVVDNFSYSNRRDYIIKKPI